ncbi:hypothetical protein GCM10028808_53900 [Spirosoma migulaei]
MRVLLILLFAWAQAVAQKPVAPKSGALSSQNKKNDTLEQNANSFVLDQAANVSAGVYDSKGILVRTLFSGIRYSAGRHRLEWDRKDDFEVPVPEGNYHIRVLSNNATYTWEGVIGNTSISFTGAGVHRGWYPPSSLVIAGDTAFYCNMYQEGNLPLNRFLLSNPQKNLPMNLFLGNNGIEYNATDGNNVYWTQFDPFYKRNANPNSVKSFVFATNIKTESPVSFSAGISVKITYNPTFSSTIDTSTKINDRISGIAVQKTGNYLFTTHPTRNEIHVLNKLTGALYQTIISIKEPQKIALEGDNSLWIISATNTVQKFTVNADGTVGRNVLLSLSGLVNPIAIAVSPDKSTVTICDAGASQQVKGFSTATGNLSWQLGTLGGYRINPTVSTNKFYFTDAKGGGNQFTFIAYAPDGSFWVGDTGNSRMLHYSNSRVYLEQVMYLNHPYTCSFDINDSTRVFAGNLEFKVDYSKLLAPDNGSWKLVRNWGPQSGNYTLYNVATLGNGKTYSFKRSSGNSWTLIELNPESGIRNTEITVPIWTVFDKAGNLYRLAKSKGVQTWHKRPLTGFSDNNPVYGQEVTYASTPVATDKDPVYGGSQVNPLARTSSGQLISFDAGVADNDAKYHLGAVVIGKTSWQWRTARSTTQNYSGEFPPDGRYDTGNGMSAAHAYGGGLALTSGKHIFWNYHGEFWKGSQTNKWNHVYDNGLFLGQFGVTRPETMGVISAPGMAGNALYPALLAINNNVIYIWHGDENDHSGLHRWKVTGLSTIREQVISVSSALPTAKVTQIGENLNAQLPYKSTLMSGTAGWVRVPDGPDHFEVGNKWVVHTNSKSYLRNNIDLSAVFCSSIDATNYVEKAFGKSTPISNWTLVGSISLEGNDGNSSLGGSYFEIFDKSNKVIARFQQTVVYKDGRPSQILGNTAVIISNDSRAALQQTINKFQPLMIFRSGSKVAFQYATYPMITADIQDKTADISSPTKLRLTFFRKGQSLTYSFDISNMRFISK